MPIPLATEYLNSLFCTSSTEQLTFQVKSDKIPKAAKICLTTKSHKAFPICTTKRQMTRARQAAKYAY